MKRKLGCLAVLFWGGFHVLAGAQSTGQYVIGEINNYSAMPQAAESYRKGWQLALEEINAAGGIQGRLINVISRDDAGKQDEAVRQAQLLITRDKVDALFGTARSNIGLAVARVAAENKKVFVAAEPLSDAITWDKGNRYTFRLRPSTYMQAAMLADEAARLPAKRWAILVPNFEYGQSAAASFKLLLRARRPDVEFVAEQWPALGKIDAGATVQALEKAKPDALFTALFGLDLVKFIQESERRGAFTNTTVVSMLSGEPENLDMLKGNTPNGWIVTGYPEEQINTPEHLTFAAAYTKKFGVAPQLGSVVGYTALTALAQGLNKAGSADSEKLVRALRGLRFDSPMGPITFRAIDQQSTMGAYVGTLEQKNGKGSMVNWHYADGGKYLPNDAYVRARRPAAAMN